MTRGARCAAAIVLALLAGCSTERITSRSAVDTRPTSTTVQSDPPITVAPTPVPTEPADTTAEAGAAVPNETLVGAAAATAPTSATSPTTTSTVPPAGTTASSEPGASLPQTTTPGLDVAADVPASEQAVLADFASRARDLFAASDGAGLAIAHNGQLVGSYVIGKDINGGPLSQTSRFRLASVSKLITAVTVLRLAEDGKIDIDRPLVQYWKPAGETDPLFQSVTIRELLDHGSGVQKLRDTFFGQDIDWRRTAERAATASLTDPPGSKFNYSNANFTLLGKLIEQVTGETYEQAVNRLVLKPMGITTATLPRTSEDPVGDPVYLTGENRHYMEALGPAGAWVMSPEDLARLVSLRTPDGASLLKPETDKLRRTPSGLDTRTPDWSYGLGLMLFQSGWGHTGTIESARTFVLTFPNGYSLAVMTSTQVVGTGEQLVRAFLPQIDVLAKLRAS